MPYQPAARKPTGMPSAPLIMVSGAPKVGKSLASYKLGKSPRIHETWVIDLGEGSADEYGQLGCYTVLDWGASWVDLQDTIKWCIAQPVPEGMMNALILDSGTEVWDGLKSRADKRARNSKKNKIELEKDPDFEVDVSMPYWNDAKDTWARIVSPMKLAGHLVGVVIVRSDIVAEVVNGAPTNRKVTSYQCEKTLPSVVTAHVDVRADHSARLVDVRSLLVSVPAGGLVLDDANPLGDLIERLAPAGGFAAPVIATPIDDERDNAEYERVSEEQAAELATLMNSVQNEDDRVVLKQTFAHAFGLPAQLPLSRLGAAMEWITPRVARMTADDPVAEPEAQAELEVEGDVEKPSIEELREAVKAIEDCGTDGPFAAKKTRKPRQSPLLGELGESAEDAVSANGTSDWFTGDDGGY